jgi:riboflavin kinase / FMN adenylyltransferase
MHVVHTFDELAKVSQNVFLAIGVFDGVHLGHQRVIGRACQAAQAGNGSAVVLTFDPHPVRVLAPDKAPPLLTSTAHKLRLIRDLGADTCLVLHFDHNFAQTPPAEFIATLARSITGLRRICVGTRFRFGHDRLGDVALIAKLASQYGYQAEEVTSAKIGEEMISSTAVRQHILEGKLDRAAAMLGRRFSVLGAVVHGAQRGRAMGFPTANVDPHNEVLPPDGVYAVYANCDGKDLTGMANIGVRPTVGEANPARRLEVNLFDFTGNLYGKEVEVTFVGKIRDEQKFDSLPALRAQITRDEQTARALLRGTM